MADRIDSIVDPVGQTYLLREAQRALVSSELAANQQAGCSVPSAQRARS